MMSMRDAINIAHRASLRSMRATGRWQASLSAEDKAAMVAAFTKACEANARVAEMCRVHGDNHPELGKRGYEARMRDRMRRRA